MNFNAGLLSTTIMVVKATIGMLVLEVSVTCDQHRHIMVIAVVDAIFIFYRTARMDDSSNACFVADLHAIRKRKKSF